MNFSPLDSIQHWHAPLEGFVLEEDEIHVWRGIVDIPLADLQVYWETLRTDERERAERFRLPQHRNRFIAVRGMLRKLLGHYLNLAPQVIELGIGPQGKPFVQLQGPHQLYFNVSHSQKLVLIAFSANLEVGIDVEGIQSRLDHQAIAKRIMNDQEAHEFYKLPESEQKSAFFACWTRKEAFVKAHGKGLTFPLRDITVSFLPGQPVSIMKVKNPELHNFTWSIYSIHTRPQYAGALVVIGQPRAIKFWDYQKWKPG